MSKARKRSVGGRGGGGSFWALVLERMIINRHFTLCFSDVVEVTNENIKQSRRLIIILVREASGFGWLSSSSEEQLVMHNALIQGGMKVVLLELERIPDEEKMPESIKFIKRKHGAIRWSGDFTEERSQSASTRFWKKVRYHMPAQQQPASSKPHPLFPAARPDSKEKLQREIPVPLG